MLTHVVDNNARILDGVRNQILVNETKLREAVAAIVRSLESMRQELSIYKNKVRKAGEIMNSFQ